MKNALPLPKEIKRRIAGRIARRALLLAVLYALLVYAVIFRFGIAYFTLRLGSLLTAVLFCAFILIPPFLVGLPQMLWIPSFEGEVLSVRRKNIVKPWAGGLRVSSSVRPDEWWRALYVTVRRADGSTVSHRVRKYEMDDLASELCAPGDMVRYYRGTLSGQIFKRDGRHDTECVMCGFYVPVEEQRCVRCGAPMLGDPPKFPERPTQATETKQDTPAAAVRTTPTYAQAHKHYSSVSDERVQESKSRLNSDMRYSAPVPTVREEIDYDAPPPEHKEKYRRKVDPQDVLILAGQTMLGYLITSYIGLMMRGTVDGTMDVVRVCLFWSGLLPLAITAFVMRSLPEAQYRVGRGAWLGQACKFILPAEGLRLVLSLFPFGERGPGAFVSPLANLAWELRYVIPSDRAEQIAQGLYIGADYGAYLPYAVIELALRAVLLFACYRVFWGIAGREREKLLNSRK